MKQRGRKSAAALRLVHVGDSERPLPPECLTHEQAEIWSSVVAAVPKDWFSAENLPILEQYCVTISRARACAAKLNKEPVGTEKYFRLLPLEQKFSRTVAMLATKMRIAQQSTYDKSRRKGAKDMRPAWDAEDESEDEVQED